MAKFGIDFDGVILSHPELPSSSNWYHNKPVKNALSGIKYLLSLEHDLYICTNRTPDEWDKVKSWLDRYGFPDMVITNVKLKSTTLYLDDRAYRFRGWKDFCKLIK